MEPDRQRAQSKSIAAATTTTPTRSMRSFSISHTFYPYGLPEMTATKIRNRLHPFGSTDRSLATTAPNTRPETAFTKMVTTRRSEEHTSELQSRGHLVCRLLLEKKKQNDIAQHTT